MPRFVFASCSSSLKLARGRGGQGVMNSGEQCAYCVCTCQCVYVCTMTGSRGGGRAMDAGQQQWFWVHMYNKEGGGVVW